MPAPPRCGGAGIPPTECRSGGVGLEPLGAGRVAQLVQSDLLDLADAFAGEPELAADLVECALAAVIESEAKPDNLLLPLRECGEHDRDLAAEQAVRHSVGRLVARVDPGHEVAQCAFAVFAD